MKIFIGTDTRARTPYWYWAVESADASLTPVNDETNLCF